MNSELLVVEHGLQTIDGKGILPGSTLIVKGEVVPPSWTGIVENCGSVKERKLIVATPDTEKQISDLSASLDAAKVELDAAKVELGKFPSLRADLESARELAIEHAKKLDAANAEIAELKKQKSK
jgi:hypothetical protein